MQAIRVTQTLNQDGELTITGLPYKKGQFLEIIVLPQLIETSSRPRMTVGQFRESGLIGLWDDHDDIDDSAVYARQLRKDAQNRGSIDYDIFG